MTEADELIEKLLIETEINQLILHNDDHNTFEKVIVCLKQYCKHSDHQAEQCSLIVHHKGKCSIKHGNLDDLLPIHESLLDKGLIVTLE